MGKTREQGKNRREKFPRKWNGSLFDVRTSDKGNKHKGNNSNSNNPQNRYDKKNP